MATQRSERLAREPLLPWRGGHPYQRLERRLRELGIEQSLSDATMRQIQDVFYDLMRAAPDTDDRLAWNRLRRSRERLLVDFLMLEVPELDLRWLDEESVPMPVRPVDFRELARLAIARPPARPPRVLETGEFARVARARVAAARIGDLAPAPTRFIEVVDG
jgi:hypothetical protein